MIGKIIYYLPETLSQKEITDDSYRNDGIKESVEKILQHKAYDIHNIYYRLIKKIGVA